MWDSRWTLINPKPKTTAYCTEAVAPCRLSPQQKSTPVAEPRRCPFPSARTLRFSPPLDAVWHGDRTPLRCYDEAHYRRSIQSTTRGKQTVTAGTERLHPSKPASSEPRLVCVPLHLVATHVVTLVHDHRFATFVVLSNIQTGFRAVVLNLRYTRVKYVYCCHIF